MSDSCLTQWIAKIDTGHVITEDDMATLARIRLALDKADQHHRQARAAQAILAALRDPSEAVMIAAEDAMDTASATDCVPGDWNTAWVLEAIRAAVYAAEKEVANDAG